MPKALINDVLRNMQNSCLFTYLDDILIFSETEAKHVQQVWWVLRLLLENGLFVKPEKCVPLNIRYVLRVYNTAGSTSGGSGQDHGYG